MIKHNLTGELKLKDNLELDYGVYTGTQYIELSEILEELMNNKVYIKIVDVKHDLELLKIKDLLHKEKVGKYPILKIGEFDLDNILFNLTNTKIRIVIEGSVRSDVGEETES